MFTARQYPPESIQEQILLLIATIKTNRVSLNKDIEKLLKNAEFFPCEKYLTELQALLKVEKSSDNIPIAYANGLKFEDFHKTNCLHAVNNVDGKNQLYFYFDKDFICDFAKLPDSDQQKFQTVSQVDNIKLAAAINDQGIKYLTDEKSLPKCHLRIKGHDYLATFSHELKIQGSPNRIAIVTLKPETHGPQILVATHVIFDGFHTKKHKGKILSSNVLDPKPLQSFSAAKLMKNLSFFAPSGCKQEVKSANENSTQPVLSK